jgi:hypothetical protein
MKKRYLTMLAAGLLAIGGAMPAQAEVVIIPFISGLTSPDTDLVVSFNASRAACYDKSFPQPTCSDPLPDTTDPDPVNHIAGGCSDDGAVCFTDDDCYDPNIRQTITDLACTFAWDFGGAGTVVGGNADTDLVVFQYAAAGTYDVTLTMTEPVSGLSESSTITVNAATVEPPDKSASFSTAVIDALCVANRCVGGGNDGYKCADDTGCPGGSVTLTFDTAAADLARAYIFWGDRTRSVLIDPAVSDSATHVYSRDRSYNIRVSTVDSDHEKLNYTSADDADLTVTP